MFKCLADLDEVLLVDVGIGDVSVIQVEAVADLVFDLEQVAHGLIELNFLKQNFDKAWNVVVAD